MSDEQAEAQRQAPQKRMHPFYQLQHDILASQQKYFAVEDCGVAFAPAARKRLSQEMYPDMLFFQHTAQHVCDRFLYLRVLKESGQKCAFFASYRMRFVQITELTEKQRFRLPTQLFEDSEIQVFLVVVEKFNQYIHRLEFSEASLVLPGTVVQLKLMMWDFNKQKLFNYQVHKTVALQFDSVFLTQPFRYLGSIGRQEGQLNLKDIVLADAPPTDQYSRQVWFHVKQLYDRASDDIKRQLEGLDDDSLEIAFNLPNFWLDLGYDCTFVFRKQFVNVYYLTVNRPATVCVKNITERTLVESIEKDGKFVTTVQCDNETLRLQIPMDIVCTSTLVLCIDCKDECYERRLNHFEINGVLLRLPLMFEGKIGSVGTVQLDSTVLTSNFALHSYFETVWNVLQVIENQKQPVSQQDFQISKQMIKQLVEILRERTMSKPIQQLVQSIGIHIRILFDILHQFSSSDQRYENALVGLLGDESYDPGESEGRDHAEVSSTERKPARRIIFSILLLIFEFGQQYCRNISLQEALFQSFTYFQYETEVLHTFSPMFPLQPHIGFQFHHSNDNSTVSRLVSTYVELDQEFTELFVKGLNQQLQRNIRMLKSSSYYLDLLCVSLHCGNRIAFNQAHELFSVLGQQMSMFAGVLAEKLFIKRQNINMNMEQIIHISIGLFKVYLECEKQLEPLEMANLLRGFLFRIQYVDLTDDTSIQSLTIQIVIKCVVIPFLTRFLVEGRYIEQIEVFIEEQLHECLKYEFSINIPEIIVIFYHYYQFVVRNQPARVQDLFSFLTDNLGQFLQIPQMMDQQQWNIMHRTLFVAYVEMLLDAPEQRVPLLCNSLQRHGITSWSFVVRLLDFFNLEQIIQQQSNSSCDQFYTFSQYHAVFNALERIDTAEQFLRFLFLDETVAASCTYDHELIANVQDRLREVILRLGVWMLRFQKIDCQEAIQLVTRIVKLGQFDETALEMFDEIKCRCSSDSQMLELIFAPSWQESGRSRLESAFLELLHKWEREHTVFESALNQIMAFQNVKNIAINRAIVQNISDDSQYVSDVRGLVLGEIDRRLGKSELFVQESFENSSLQYDALTECMALNIGELAAHNQLEQFVVLLEKHKNYQEAANVNALRVLQSLQSIEPKTAFERQLEQILSGFRLKYGEVSTDRRYWAQEVVHLVQKQFNLLSLAQNLESAVQFLQILLNNNQQMKIYSAAQFKQANQLLQKQKKQVVAEQLYSTRHFGYFYRIHFKGSGFGAENQRVYVLSRSLADRCFDVQHELTEFYGARVPGMRVITTCVGDQSACQSEHIQLLSLFSFVPEHFRNDVFRDLMHQLSASCEQFDIPFPPLCQNPAHAAFSRQIFYFERSLPQAEFTTRVLCFQLCKNAVPGMATRIEVAYEFTYQLTPVQSATLQFAQQLHQVRRQIQLRSFYALTELQMTLQGIAAANVNGGPILLAEQLIDSGKFVQRDIYGLVKELRSLADATGDLLKLCDQIPKPLQEFHEMLTKAVGILRGKANVLWDQYKMWG